MEATERAMKAAEEKVNDMIRQNAEKRANTDSDEPAPPEVNEPDNSEGREQQGEPEGQEPEGEEVDLQKLKKQYEDLQKAHESFQKKYKAEVAPVMRERDQLLKSHSWLQQRVMDLEEERKRIQQPQEPPPVEQPKFGKIDMQRFQEEYDDPTLRTMAENLNAMTDFAEAQRQEMAQIKNQMGQVAARPAQQVSKVNDVMAMLDIDPEMKGWSEVNDSPDFHEWLNTRPPLNNRTYGEILHGSADQGDYKTVKDVYRAFNGFNAAVQPETQGEHIVPATSRASTPPGKYKTGKKEEVKGSELTRLANVAAQTNDPKDRKAFEDAYARFLQEKTTGR